MAKDTEDSKNQLIIDSKKKIFLTRFAEEIQIMKEFLDLQNSNEDYYRFGLLMYKNKKEPKTLLSFNQPKSDTTVKSTQVEEKIETDKYGSVCMN